MNLSGTTISNMNTLPDPTLPLNNQWYGSIQDRFYTNVSNHTAIYTAYDSWTYEDLDHASNQIAHHILMHTNGDNNVVGIYAGRNAALVISLLGIVKAGFAFVILDPRYPLKRLLNYLTIAKPIGLLNTTYDDKLPPEIVDVSGINGCKFIVDVPPQKNNFETSNVFKEHNINRIIQPVSPSDTLYIAFTSGTTGTPKAIIGSHSPVTHFFHWQETTFNLQRKHRISVLSGLAHDPLLRDILMPLWVGATICMPDEDCLRDPQKLVAWMKESQVNVTHLTPSMGHVILSGARTAQQTILDSLEYAFFGGDRLTYKLAKRFKTLAPHASIINCYGTTETPQVMGFYIVNTCELRNTETQERKALTVPIGKGISDCQMLVLNDDKQQCGIGQEGEIYVRTPYQAKEIVEGTANYESPLIPNPFTKDSTDLIYCTGDFGCYLADGSVTYMGRRDKQVKVRGFRIELAEIEKVLADDNNIFQYIVDIECNREGENYIAVYYIPGNDTSKARGCVRNLLADHLPNDMIPDKIIALNTIPLTPNGKIDRIKLQELSTIDAAHQSADLFSLDDAETKLIDILKGMLYSSAINLNDQIFDIGINSLQIIEICCAIEEAFNIGISVSDIAQCNRISDISRLIQERKHEVVIHGTTSGIYNIWLNDKPSLNNTHGASFADKGEPTPGYVSANTIPIFPHGTSAKLLPDNENIAVGIKNRLLQLFARITPDVLRIKLHKLRGVTIGDNASIGYDTIIETSYPWLVRIGNNVNIGMRVTIIAHFRGMAKVAKGTYTVDIKDYAFIGPGVIILPNVVIGEGSVVSAGSVVSSNIPPLTLVQGNPARAIAKCGVALSGPTTYREFIANLKPL